MNFQILLSAVDVTEKMNAAFTKILTILQALAYMVIVLKCIVDVIKMMGKGDRKSVLDTVILNVILFATIYITPWVFDLIKDIFSK